MKQCQKGDFYFPLYLLPQLIEFKEIYHSFHIKHLHFTKNQNFTFDVDFGQIQSVEHRIEERLKCEPISR